MNQEGQKPMKKTKAPLLILALAALAALLYAVSRPAATDPAPYESFTLAMDKLFGPGQWSVQSHEGSSGGLSVKGLNLKLPSGLDIEGLGQPLALSADSVFIRKLPSKSQMENLVSLADWQGRPETLLADLMRFQGFRIQGEGDFETKLEIEELKLERMKLAQAGEAGPAGEAGFWKAFHLGGVDYKNLNITVKSPEAEASAVVKSASFEGLGFDGDVPSGLLSLPGLDAIADLKILAGLNFKNLKAAGLKMDFQGLAPEAKLQAAISLDALEETNVQAFKSVGALKLTGFKSRLTDDEGQVISLNLAEFSLRGLEAADYLTKILAGLAEAKDNLESAQILLAGQFTLADFIVSPISLEEMSLTGLDLDFAGLATVKLAEMKAVGPYRTGAIPPSAKSWVRGLEINLPGDPKAEPDTPGRDIYEFSQKLGRNSFNLETEVEGAYEAGKGLWTTKLNRFSVRDLFDLSFGSSWGGLTLDRLEKFKNTPLSAFYLGALNPGDLLGDASFEAFNIKYTDQGLVDLIFNLRAAEEGGNVTGAELKDRTIVKAGLMLMIGAQYLKNVEALSRPLLDFLKAPGSLEIDIKPSKPLTFSTVSALGDEEDPLVILDALNITISANGVAGSPLRFVTGSAYEDDE